MFSRLAMPVKLCGEPGPELSHGREDRKTEQAVNVGSRNPALRSDFRAHSYRTRVARADALLKSLTLAVRGDGEMVNSVQIVQILASCFL